MTHFDNDSRPIPTVDFDFSAIDGEAETDTETDASRPTADAAVEAIFSFIERGHLDGTLARVHAMRSILGRCSRSEAARAAGVSYRQLQRLEKSFGLMGYRGKSQN